MLYTPDFSTALLVGSITGLISAYFAYRRHRSPLFWFLIGFFFGLLGVIAFFLAPSSKKKRVPSHLEQPNPVPQPYLFGPSDKFWYYLNEAREQIGPLSHHGITNAWKEGKLSSATFIWHEELSEWKPLQELVRNQE